MERLKQYYDMVKGYKVLSINEAKNLYLKAVNSTTEREKLFEQLVLGTLAVIYKHLESIKVELFKTASYDVDDIVSAYTSAWVDFIHSGEILNNTSYSKILNNIIPDKVFAELGINVNDNFVNAITVIDELVVPYQNVYEGTATFEEIFDDLSEENKIRFFGHSKSGINRYLNNLYDALYQNANYLSDDVDSKVTPIDIKKTNFRFLRELYLNLGINEELKEQSFCTSDTENKVVNRSTHEWAIKKIFDECKKSELNTLFLLMLCLKWRVDFSQCEELCALAREYDIPCSRYAGSVADNELAKVLHTTSTYVGFGYRRALSYIRKKNIVDGIL